MSQYLSNPLVSIIVPTYNAEAFLSRCLNSLLDQTLKNIEIICINDGSYDNTLDILHNFAQKDSRLKVFTQMNSGPAKARNTGLRNATGKYLMFCDSDDWYDLNMCERMVQLIEKHNVDFAMCNANFHIEDGEHNRSQEEISSHTLRTTGYIKLNSKNRSKIFVVLWNKIFKKSIVDKYQITFPDGYEFDDNSFIYQYTAAANTTYGSPEKLYNYVVRCGSIMATLKHAEKYPHCVGSLSHTILSLKRNSLLEDGNFINDVIYGQLVWFSRYLNSKDLENFFNLFALNVISKIDSEIINRNNFLKELSKGNFKKYITQHDNIKNIKRKKLLGITVFKKIKSPLYSKYYFLGLQIFKRVINEKNVIHYLFGIPLLKTKNRHGFRKRSQLDDKNENSFIVYLDYGWFGFNSLTESPWLKKNHVQAFSVPIFIESEEDSSQLQQPLTSSSFRTYVYKNIHLFEICAYEICVRLQIENIKHIDFLNPLHKLTITKVFRKAIYTIDKYKSFIDSKNPKMVVYPQGYMLEAAILRLLSKQRSIPSLAIENTCKSDKILIEKRTGITVTYNSINSNFEKQKENISTETAQEYWNEYLEKISSFKHTEHSSPSNKLQLSTAFKKTILYLAQVGTDASVLFSNHEFESQSALIKYLIETQTQRFRVIIKFHPKEYTGKNPVNLEPYAQLTYSNVKKTRSQLAPAKSDLILDYENIYNTYDLISQSDLCITINSQSGLEASCMGKPVITCGQSFYKTDNNIAKTKKQLNILLDQFYKEELKFNPINDRKMFYYYLERASINKDLESLSRLIVTQLQQPLPNKSTKKTTTLNYNEHNRNAFY